MEANGDFKQFAQAWWTSRDLEAASAACIRAASARSFAACMLTAKCCSLLMPAGVVEHRSSDLVSSAAEAVALGWSR